MASDDKFLVDFDYERPHLEVRSGWFLFEEVCYVGASVHSTYYLEPAGFLVSIFKRWCLKTGEPGRVCKD